MKNKKTAMLTVLSILALSMIGFTYAMWSETLTISGSVATGELDWEFVSGTYTQKDPSGSLDWNSNDGIAAVQMTKDVGSTTIVEVDSDKDGDIDTLVVTFDNVYPLYYEHIAWKLHNNGEIPLIIWKVIVTDVTGSPYEFFGTFDEVFDLSGDGVSDIRLWYGNNFGDQVHPCTSVDISFDLVVQQEAPQGGQLSFTLEIVAVQYNEYPGPVPYP